MKSYFSHDSNARSDEKLIALRIKHGWQGYGLYWALVEKLRDSTCYKLATDYNLIAYDLRTDASIIKSIINDFGLFAFSDNGECFYSESLLRRMEMKDEKAKKLSDAGKKGMAKRWGNKLNNNNFESGEDNKVITTLKLGNNNKSKVKKKKRKKESTIVDKKEAALAATNKRKEEFYNSLVPFLDTYSPAMIRNFYDYWSELNSTNTKMKFEKEKTWELSKRLSYWARNDKNFTRQDAKRLLPASEEEKNKLLNRANF